MGHVTSGLRSVPHAWSVWSVHTSVCAATNNCIPDFQEAADQFTKVLAIDPYRIDDIDIYSNILYVTEDHRALSRIAHEFTVIDKDRPEVCCLIGTIYGGDFLQPIAS